ncbi:hypothetical protein LCGC14_0162670 [marine sediment metagenome]
MNIPDDLNYTEQHEWVRFADGVATVGISDFAQDAFGDLVFVDLPPLDKEFVRGDEVIAMESTKAAASVYAPVSGKVVEVNERLVDDPGLVNSDCYGEGWMFKLAAPDPAGLDDLMDAAGYEAFLTGLEED